MTKARADLDEWCKEAAPTTELRRWYAHDPERFAEFRRRYKGELKTGEQAEAITHLRHLAAKRRVTLLTAAKGPTISEATVLADVIRPRTSR